LTKAIHSGPLEGIRVLDFTNMMVGPYCTRLLADLGAEVIKIEPPSGDHNRSHTPLRNGRSTYFGHLNAGKLSVSLNLKNEHGLAAAIELVKHCDVVVENWRPGVADRIGLGYSALSAQRPDIVYCSISGFGQTGPKARHAAYAPIVHASSGFDLAHVAYQGGGRPPNTGTFIGDMFGGMSALAAIQTALLKRALRGGGQYIDVALLDGMLNLLVWECQVAQFPDTPKRSHYRPFGTGDGYVSIAPTSQKNFVELSRALGHPEWVSDDRFCDQRRRDLNFTALGELIEAWTKTKTSQECEELLIAAAVPCSRYRTVAEVMQDPSLAQRGTISQVKDESGSYMVFNAPFQMPGCNTSVRERVPEKGADTADVLGRLLGYSAEQAKACAL